jgi:hypothetical protein
MNTHATFLLSRRFVTSCILTAAILLCAYIAAPMRAHAQRGAEILVTNNWGRDIHKLYLSPAKLNNWGPDQLGNSVIKAGAKFRLHNIACNKYDIKIVDGDGDACVMENVSLCEDSSELILNC